MEYKKNRNTSGFPSAISSKAWRDFHEQKENLKKIKLSVIREVVLREKIQITTPNHPKNERVINIKHFFF